jgi:ABC-2 type transport system ATP-binding protein
MNYAIETNGLSKFYGDVCAVDSVDLRVGVGEIYGFLGLNGAGKTDWVFVVCRAGVRWRYRRKWRMYSSSRIE